MDVNRNLGTSKQAQELVGVSSATLRNWLHRGLISGVRVGRGRFMYDLDSVAAMRVEYPLQPHVDQLAAAAPEFTPEQINQIRLLLHSGGDAA